MKHIYPHLILLFLLSLPLTVSLPFCSLTTDPVNLKNTHTKTILPQKFDEPLTWTLMLYMNADNDLEQAALNDLNELELVPTDTRLHIIALVDRINGFSESDGDWTDTRIYHILFDPNGLNDTLVSKELASPQLGLTLSHPEELAMDDPQTVAQFINFCQSHFPADRYAFIFWNHGTGWIDSAILNSRIATGISEDYTSTSFPNFMQINEIRDVLLNQSIHVLGFDACLMGMLEIAFELRDTAKILIASADNIPPQGWNYDQWLISFLQSQQFTPEALAQYAVSSFAEHYHDVNTSLVALNLAYIEDTIQCLNHFLSPIRTLSKEEVASRIFYYTTHYFDYSFEIPPDQLFRIAYIDLYSFMNQFPESSLTKVCHTTMENLILDSSIFSDSPHLMGLSIYFKRGTNSFDDHYTTILHDFTTQSDWPDFLHWINQ